jgi:hypothetical protein
MGRNIPVARTSVTESKGILGLTLLHEVFPTVLIGIENFEIRGTLVPDHALRAYNRSRCIVPLVLNLGTILRRTVANLHAAGKY